MGKILSKQIKGAVDLNSNQIIGGKKTFSAPIICLNQESSHHIVQANGFIFWVQNPEKLEEEGNYRLGIVEGQLSIQHFSENQWIINEK